MATIVGAMGPLMTYVLVIAAYLGAAVLSFVVGYVVYNLLVKSRMLALIVSLAVLFIVVSFIPGVIPAVKSIPEREYLLYLAVVATFAADFTLLHD